MAQLLLMTAPNNRADDVLPALELLSHQLRTTPSAPASLTDAAHYDLILVDARTDWRLAKNLCRMAHSVVPQTPVMCIVSESALAAISPDWHVADLLLTTAGPTEVSARIRLVLASAESQRSRTEDSAEKITVGSVVIDTASYTTKVNGSPLNLTYKEFELLRFMATYPGRVFTREELLHEVWGYDYFGGTRTVDVHVRRLRAKLGPDQEQLIGTVRNVGYCFAQRNASDR